MSKVITDVRLWVQARLILLRHTAHLVFTEADTVTIRVLLAWSSLFAAIALLADPGRFGTAPYAVVAEFGSEQAWAGYFLLHFAGTHWRLFERSRSRPRWALLINTFGFAIWFVATASISWAVGSVGISTAMGFTLCLASAWSMYRTGLSRDVVSL